MNQVQTAPRYAIYYCPAPETALWQVASAWIGRDSHSDHARARPVGLNLAPDEVAATTANPRRYGFHATLVAPFELTDDSSEADLRAALADFCTTRSAFETRLEVGHIDDFLALVPTRPEPRLDTLAADCLHHFDRFRAPLSDYDLARRDDPDLTPHERDNLRRWGYPWVLDAFRFHMSLTGAVPPAQRDRFAPSLRGLFADVLDLPIAIDGLSLVKQGSRLADFRTLSREPFPGR